MANLSVQERVAEYISDEYHFSIDTVSTMLPSLLSVLQNHMRDMADVLQQGEIQAIATVGHTLKGALLNLGLDDIAEFARTIEVEGKADNRDVDYSSLVAQLQTQLVEIL